MALLSVLGSREEEVPHGLRHFDGLVFNRVATLGLWGGLAALAAAVNLVVFGWASIDVGPWAGPSPTEQMRAGGLLSIYGLLYLGAGLAFLHGTRTHSRRMLTPWLLVGAFAAIHLLLGVPMLSAGWVRGGDGGLGLLVWLNPVTYVMAAPVVLTLVRWRNWRYLAARLVAVVAVVTSVLVWVLAHH